MKWFMDLKISVKLLTGFVFLSVITILIGYIGLSDMSELNANTGEMYSKQLVPIAYLGEIAADFQHSRVYMNEILLSGNKEEQKSYLEKAEEILKKIEENDNNYEQTILTQEGKATFGRYKDDLKSYKQVIEQSTELALEGRKDEAIQIMHGKGLELTRKVQTDLKEMVTQKDTLAKQNYNENSEKYSNTRVQVVIFISAGVILSLMLGLFISGKISKSIKQSVDFAKAIAKGDLTQKLRIDQKDEIGDLSNAMNEMVSAMGKVSEITKEIASGNLLVEAAARSEKDELMHSLNKMIHELTNVVVNVKTASDNVASGSQQMSSSSEQLSQGATEQAASAEEASSS
ncbi:MAG: MCP four helix bundle domain-containing protein, partial [Bacillota bacterium]